MGYGFKIKVWGEYACFSRPELKVERVSYDFLTPTAAKGILEAIYWKPAIIWHIDKIHVINEVKFTNIRRNEVSEVAKLSKISNAVKNSVNYDISSTGNRHQRAATILKDVEYIIEAHFELNEEKIGETDTIEKHYNIMLRRLRQGQFFYKPTLGTREFSASFSIIENEEEIPKSELVGEQDFGFMLYSLNYKLEKNGEKTSVSPSFFRAKTINGVCDLTNIKEVVS